MMQLLLFSNMPYLSSQMKTGVSFAIIGCGRIAARHAEHIQSCGTLQAVCDTDTNKANDFSNKFHCASYTSLETLISQEKNTDVIAICTPNGLHAQQTITCLQAGYHVICEKPMAIASSDCIQMMKAADASGKKLFVVKQNRYNPPVAAIKKLVDENKTGKIYSVQLNCYWNRDAAYYKDSWRGTENMDGGTLFTQFSHFIDLLQWMFGDIKKVYALTANLAHENIIAFEDSGVVSLQFENNILGSIHFTINSFKKNMEGSLTVFAEKGTWKIGGEYLNELEYQLSDEYIIKDLPAGNTANHYGAYTGSMSNHDKVYENVLEVLLHNKPLTTSAYDGFKTVEIIEKIYTSAATLNKE